MSRRWALLVGGSTVVLALCAGCRGMADQVTQQPVSVQTGQSPVQTGQAGSGPSAGDPAAALNNQLDQLQSTLDSVAAALNADSSAP